MAVAELAGWERPLPDSWERERVRARVWLRAREGCRSCSSMEIGAAKTADETRTFRNRTNRADCVAGISDIPLRHPFAAVRTCADARLDRS